jgi:hypothetical protein
VRDLKLCPLATDHGVVFAPDQFPIMMNHDRTKYWSKINSLSGVLMI